MTFPAAVDGVGSMLPAASMARTVKRWPPAASRLYERGETQRPNDAEASRHWNLDAPRPAKVKLCGGCLVFARRSGVDLRLRWRGVDCPRVRAGPDVAGKVGRSHREGMS